MVSWFYRWVFLSGLLVPPVLPCKDQVAARPVFIDGHAQGTTYHIVYYAADSLVTKGQIDSILDKIDYSLSLYRPNSLINTFNSSPSGIRIDDHFIKVVKRSLEVYADTHGIFDITVKPLVQVWGFGVTPITQLPDSAQILDILKCVGSGLIHLRKDRLVKDKPCVSIDVNGIAQGYSVDVLADFLEGHMIRNYLVELGGEIRVKGRKLPGADKMRIGIETPANDDFEARPLQRIIAPDSGAITTSGNYRKSYLAGTKRISHLIDPKTGYSIDNELISVTVYAKDAITADGYDNALMGMGLKGAFSFLEQRKEMGAYFIYHRPDGSVADTSTKNFPVFLAQ